VSVVTYDEAPTPLTDRERNSLHRMFSDYMEVPGEWKTALRKDLESDPPNLALGGRGVGPTGPPGPTGPQGPPGPTGASGTSSFVCGAGDPTAAVGVDGGVYMDTSNGHFWGPKASGAWPSSPMGRLMPLAPTWDKVRSG